jgi:hypothetical protein
MVILEQFSTDPQAMSISFDNQILFILWFETTNEQSASKLFNKLIFLICAVAASDKNVSVIDREELCIFLLIIAESNWKIFKIHFFPKQITFMTLLDTNINDFYISSDFPRVAVVGRGMIY